MKTNITHYDIQNMMKRFKGTCHYQSFIHDGLIHHIADFVVKDLRSSSTLLLNSVLHKRVEAILNELCAKKQRV
jgi:hypothetical protein